jgi:hypothetical protein
MFELQADRQVGVTDLLSSDAVSNSGPLPTDLVKPERDDEGLAQ